jgi:hypothetical protein
MSGDDDMLEGIEELLRDDDEVDDGYARTSPALIAVHAIERAADEMAAAVRGNVERWWFAIPDTHRALTAALVQALSGTAGIGVLCDRDAQAWMKYFEDSRSDPNTKVPREGFVAEFGELLSRAQDPQRRNDMHGTLVLTEGQCEDLGRLNACRDRLEHPKPSSWSLEVAGLPRILGTAAQALDQLLSMASIQLKLDPTDLKRAKAALAAMLKLAAEHPSKAP